MTELESLRNKEHEQKKDTISTMNDWYNYLSKDDIFDFRWDDKIEHLEIYGSNGLLKKISIWGDNPAAIIADISKAMLEYM